MRGRDSVPKLRGHKAIGRLRLVFSWRFSQAAWSKQCWLQNEVDLLRASPTASLTSLSQCSSTLILKRFCSATWPCVCLKLSMGNTSGSRRQSRTSELELPSYISYLSPCKEVHMTVLSRLALHCTTWICLRYCSFSEGEISELRVGILLLAISYILHFLNSVFERVLVIHLYPLYLYCFMLVYILRVSFSLSHVS